MQLSHPYCILCLRNRRSKYGCQFVAHHIDEPHLSTTEDYSTPLYDSSLSSLRDWYILYKRRANKELWEPKITKQTVYLQSRSQCRVFFFSFLWFLKESHAISYRLVSYQNHFIAQITLRFKIPLPQDAECLDYNNSTQL